MTDALSAPAVDTLSADRRALLARRLRRPDAAAAPAPIPRRAQQDPPLSYAQERLWFLEQYAPGTTAYTVPLVRRVRGPLEPEALRSGLRAVVGRHEALRTRFTATEDGKPLASVLDRAEPSLRLAAAEDEQQARALVDAELAAPVDPARAPLLRALLVALGPDEHVLALAVHHLACDGWSAERLLGEILDIACGGEPEPEPAVRYGDFAAWQRTGRDPQGDARDLAYWLPRLDGVPALDLPLDHPRPARHTAAGAAHSFAFGPRTSRRVAELARACAATPYMVLLTAYQVLLGRVSGQHDFAVGTPVAGRTRPELEEVVGLFVNTLALRADLDPARTFREQLERVRGDVLDAFAHQELPYERLVAALDPVRDPSRTPVFQTLFALQNYDGATSGAAGPLEVEGFPLGRWAARFELELYVTGDPEQGDGYHGQFVHSTDCYEPATVERLGRALRTLLDAAVTDPDTATGLLPLLDAEGEAAALSASTGPRVAFPDDTTLHALVAAGLRADPGRTAVTAPDGELTRAQLAARANRVAHTLRDRGVGPGDLVAVCAERSLDLVVGLLGVLEAGAAYLPLDPEYPRERLEFMLADSGARMLLTQRRLAADVPGSADLLLLDDEKCFAGQPETDPEPLAGPLDPAYALYTSGSTGRPKGVLVPHRAIVNRLDWMQRSYPLTRADAVLQKTPASFDVSVWEFFWPLLAGARLVLARPGGHKDPEYLRDVIAEQGVTCAHFVPAMLGAFTAAEDIERCRSLRLVVCSGEELPPAAAAALHARLDVELHNLYGPTEAAVDVSAWPCPPGECADAARLPIGRPIQNVRLYVLDDQDRLQPDGVPGQLHIAGPALAHGYLGRPALTAERFRPDPYGPPGARMYATGDLALRRPDGALEFLGRIDRQVKIRGMRIEPGEIEAALTALPDVRQAAVVVREDRPGDQRLVAYLTGPGDGAEPARLREELRRTLPEHLVPAAFVTLPDLPLTPSGKLDRSALPAPVATAPAAETAPPAPGAEQDIAAIWQEVLDLPVVGAEDDFFALGGHSLLATQVVARMRKRLDAQVTVLDLFQHPTVRALARLAQTPEEERGPGELLHELTRGVTGTAELTLVCVPYGGGSAVVYQPLADELPPGHRLFAVSMPGHDLGRAEEAIPFEELVVRCTQEILDKVRGPVALYGHCAIGSAVAVELARRLEAAGRVPEAVYVAGIFPFARPRSRALRALSALARRDRLTGHRVYENWLRGLGLELGDLDVEQAHRIVRTMREDSESAERHFTALLDSRVEPIRAPVVSVVGDRDPATEFAQERYREWHFLSPTTGLVVLDEAGHFFLKYRAAELAGILTRTARALGSPESDAIGPAPGRTWWLAGQSRQASGEGEALPGRRPAPPPSLRRFLAVASGQLVSITGSALTEFAIPIWIYLHTGSLARYTLFTALGLVPGLLVAPLAGAVVDRSNRKHVMLAADCAAGGVQMLFALLVWSGELRVGQIYGFVMVLSVALTFQRLAYGSAVPQLVPKQYLGHANGITQMIGGAAQTLAPLLAAGLLALVGLGGILALDVASYAVAVAVTAAVRFPRTLPWRPRETLLQEIRSGLGHSWRTKGLRAMLLFFAVFNVFLSPLFILLTPLTLSLGPLADAGWVSLCAGLGAVAGGLVMGVWGGPRQRRMHGILGSALALAACCAVPGLGASTWWVAGGAFLMSGTLAVMNGVYFTTVQVKVAQRFHGRVFALNTVISWSTLPLGFAVVAPLGSRLLEPLMARHGALADTVGRVLGTGPGRGIALLYLLFAAAMAAVVVAARRVRALRTFDTDLPDAPPDDLVGLEILRARAVPLDEQEQHTR